MLQPEQAPHAANLDNGLPIRRSRSLPGVSRGHAIPPRRYRAVLIAALTATLVFTAPTHAEPAGSGRLRFTWSDTNVRWDTNGATVAVSISVENTAPVIYGSAYLYKADLLSARGDEKVGTPVAAMDREGGPLTFSLQNLNMNLGANSTPPHSDRCSEPEPCATCCPGRRNGYSAGGAAHGPADAAPGGSRNGAVRRPWIGGAVLGPEPNHRSCGRTIPRRRRCRAVNKAAVVTVPQLRSNGKLALLAEVPKSDTVHDSPSGLTYAWALRSGSWVAPTESTKHDGLLGPAQTGYVAIRAQDFA